MSHLHRTRWQSSPPFRFTAAAILGLAAAASLSVSGSATSGTLIVTTDTTLTEDHHGDVVIDADGVTLDCAGHRLLGSGEQAGVSVEGRTRVKVRGCRSEGFQAGFNVARSSQVWLEGNQALDNDTGFLVSLSDHVDLRENVARANVHGFALGDISESTVADNQATGNSGDGFLFIDSDGNLLERNIAEDNMGFGFLVRSSDGNSANRNIAFGNEGGFRLEDSAGMAMESNESSDNRGHGFLLIRARLSRLQRNTANANAGDGFHIEHSIDVALKDNVASGNAGNEVGVEASSNIAFHDVPSSAQTSQGGSGLPYALELLSFLGLASAIWLGVYLVGQPSRTRVSWLTALTLWSLAGVFLDDFMTFNQPAAGFLQQIQSALGFWPGAGVVLSRLLLLGWVSKYAVVLWYHASSLMRPVNPSRARRLLILAGYILATAAVVLQLTAPDSLASSAPLYPLFAAGLLAYLALSLINLIERVRHSRSAFERRQFVLLLTATIIASLSGTVYLAGEFLGPNAASAPGSIMLWLAVVLLGYGVANYSAIVEGRTVRRHFVYSLVAVSSVTLLYFVVSYLSSVSFGVRTAAFAFVILLAVVTHSLAGNARAILDYFFVDPETRKVLQAFRRMPNSLRGEGKLEERLGLVLDNLCTEVRASYGLVLLVSDDSLRLAAGYRWNGSTNLGLRAEAVAVDDIQPLKPGFFPPPLDGAALLAPLYLELQHLGGVLLGHPVNGPAYTPAEVDLAGYATDRMVEIVRVKHLEDEALAGFAQVPASPSPGLSEGEPSLETVETALRRINDFVFLGSCPLSLLRVVAASAPADATHIDRGKATHHVLAEAIETLRPAGQRPPHSSPREWHHYMILHEAYVMDRPNRDVMSELYISEGTFNRRRREAIAAVTRSLREGEEGRQAVAPAA